MQFLRFGARRTLGASAIAIIVLSIATFFQNCSSGPQSGSSVSRVNANYSASMGGNGEGYTGMRRFDNVALDGTCGAETVRSAVEVYPDGKTMIVRENCQDVAARPLDSPSLGLLPHDPDHLFYGGHVFEHRSEPNYVSSLVCRADSVLPDSPNHTVLDMLIRKSAESPDAPILGRLLVGEYDANYSLISSLGLSDIELTEVWGPDGLHVEYSFTGPTQEGSSNVFLHVMKQDDGSFTGTFDYISFTSTTDFSPANQGVNYRAQSVTCTPM